MDCRVVVEAAVPVFDVATEDEAIRIAISKTGEMLNPDLNYVEIDMGERTSPSGEELPPAFIAADEALVALELEMTVFNVERKEHASRIARKEIGQRLENIPLEVLTVDILEDDTDESETEAEESGDEAEADKTEANESETKADESEDGVEKSGSEADGVEPASTDENTDGETTDEQAGDEDVLPEFEDLLE